MLAAILVSRRQPVRSARCTYTRLAPFGVLRLNLFLTIEKAFDSSLSRFSFPGVERPFDPAQSDVKRDFHFLPTLDQRPIHRTKKQMLSAPSNKRIFDFGKIIEIIHAGFRLRS